MKLLARSVKPLSRLEKKIYQPILAPVEKCSREAYFIAHADKYRAGDENLLPYPERCTKGIWLTAMAQHIAQSKLSVVLAPQNSQLAKLLRQKLRSVYEARAYVCSAAEVQASVYGRFGSPFDYWRDQSAPLIPKVPETALVVVDPSESLLETSTEEFTLSGALVQSEVGVEELVRQLSAAQTYSQELSHLKTLAGVGLTKVTAVDGGIYLSHA